MQPAPIISVVIPTYRRPTFLPSAVASCLEGSLSGEVEVIVVPNGSDTSWQGSLEGFAGNPMVKVFPIDIADANTARNHGLENCTARYVRFLDDDDTLLTSGSKDQYALMDKTGADICTGAVSLTDDSGDQFEVIKPPPTTDFISALLAREIATIPTAHVFRRPFIQSLRWLPNQPFLQDQLWMHIVGRHADPVWIKTDSVVGVWHHHDGYRISIDGMRSVHTALVVTSQILIDTIARLSATSRMNPARTTIAARGLWAIAHECFYLSPLYWHGVARTALSLNADLRLDHGLSTTSVGKHMHPLVGEWLSVPGRWVAAFMKWLFRRSAK